MDREPFYARGKGSARVQDFDRQVELAAKPRRCRGVPAEHPNGIQGTTGFH